MGKITQEVVFICFIVLFSSGCTGHKHQSQYTDFICPDFEKAFVNSSLQKVILDDRSHDYVFLLEDSGIYLVLKDLKVVKYPESCCVEMSTLARELNLSTIELGNFIHHLRQCEVTEIFYSQNHKAIVYDTEEYEFRYQLSQDTSFFSENWHRLSGNWWIYVDSSENERFKYYRNLE